MSGWDSSTGKLAKTKAYTNESRSEPGYSIMLIEEKKGYFALKLLFLILSARMPGHDYNEEPMSWWSK